MACQPSIPGLTRFVIVAWSLLAGLLAILLAAAGRLVPRLRELLAEGDFHHQRAAALRAEAAAYGRRYVFFCSSAGEYEQALPLILRLQEDGAYVHTLFFSPSGLRYLRARGDEQPHALAPLDRLGSWQRYFAALQPQAVVVVRHELWPCFLYQACRSGARLYLINASASLASRQSFLNRQLKGRLLRFFHGIYAVGEADGEFFRHDLHVEASRLHVCGDSKYDRVMERRQLRGETARQLQEFFSTYLPARSRLVLGSGWDKDVLVSLQALELLIAQGQGEGLQLCVALHEPSPQRLQWVREECTKRGLTLGFFNHLWEAAATSPARVLASALQVIVVDKMGILAELYSTAHLAFVGGALHYQVHNVLEPASYGLALGYGPLYKNSGEAVSLVEEGLATVIRQADDYRRWWQAMIATNYEVGQKTLLAVNKRCGATSRLYQDIARETGKD